MKCASRVKCTAYYCDFFKTCYSEEQVISMLEFLIDNIFVSFGGIMFQQVVGIPMGTNCAPVLADLFLYSYESRGGSRVSSYGGEGGSLKKIAPSGGRRENFWGISCEKSRFYAKK
jgi:hypothetical protein